MFTRSTLFAAIISAALLAPAASFAADTSEADFQKMMDAYLGKEENQEKIALGVQSYFQKQQQNQQRKQAEQEEKEMEDQFKNPIKVELGKAPVKGNPAAKFTIVEFSDFECPYCQRGADEVEKVVKMYPNDIKVAFKHYPLPFHQKAIPASKAAMAAGEQGKFWEMYELLFANQDALTTEGFVAHAQKLGLDVEKFKKDLANPEYDKTIAADMEQGKKLGINGTPGFFVNGVAVKGARPAQYFAQIIERLKAQK
jgi:protein-disulfide isomerase